MTLTNDKIFTSVKGGWGSKEAYDKGVQTR